MSSLGESIFTELKKFYHAFVDKKILKTAEEVAANTNDHNLASAVVVGEIYNNLKGFEPILDSTGKITGYKTNVNNLTQATTTYSVSFNWHGIPCAFLYL